MKTQKIAVFGGAFDPLTVGYEAIIEYLLEHYETVHIYVTDNDEKQYSAPREDRRAMIAERFGNAVGRTMEIFIQDTRTYELLQSKYKPEDIDLILGYDELVALTKKTWKNSDELLNTYSIRVIPRNGVMVRDGEFAEFGNIVGMWVVASDISSTQVRREMYMNPMYNGSGVSVPVYNYISRKGLYRQENIISHMMNEGKEMAGYEPGNYPKPSVTVTLVIINAIRDDRIGRQDQVLLVRRKKFPFANYWCLPGGFTNPHESVEQSAARELQEETGLKQEDCLPLLRQLKVYLPDDPRADLRHFAEFEQKALDAQKKQFEESVASAQPWTLDKTIQKLQIAALASKKSELDARQKEIDALRNHWVYDVALYAKGPLFPNVHGEDDALEAAWVPLSEARKTKLAFHHNQILEDYVATVGE